MRLVVLLLLGLCTVARAEIDRYAVIIGHNTGAADEQRLRFAETDAQRVADVLGDLGGIPDENQVVLRGKASDQVRRALIAMNERIRVAQRAGRTAVLVVFYSGHGDQDALHLGETRFELRELEALVRGSSAEVRVLVIDACRSGSVTRVKGGRPTAPITITSGDDAPGEGVVVLTASTAGEDAQESDDLGGSFFTHFLLSGLQGAADEDANQIVTISEAFQYTRDQTILASSRTQNGTQHPTFHYDLRGRAEIALSELGGKSGRGTLAVPGDGAWLVIRAAPIAVVGEISAGTKRRTLSLRAGRYQVRGRTRDALLEGTVTVAAGVETRVDPAALDKVAYAKLVRKGGGEILASVAGPFGGAIAQSPVIEGASPCLGLVAGWTIERAMLTLSPRLSACHGTFANRSLSASADQLALEVRGGHAWDIGPLAIDLGITGAVQVMQERFDTRGVAPTRTSISARVDAGALLTLPLGRLRLVGEIAGQTHFFSVEDQAGATSGTARFAIRAMLGLGIWL